MNINNFDPQIKEILNDRTSTIEGAILLLTAFQCQLSLDILAELKRTGGKADSQIELKITPPPILPKLVQGKPIRNK